MQGAHHVLHLILSTRHLANDRLSGPLGGLREAIPLHTALHALQQLLNISQFENLTSLTQIIV